MVARLGLFAARLRGLLGHRQRYIFEVQRFPVRNWRRCGNQRGVCGSDRLPGLDLDEHSVLKSHTRTKHRTIPWIQVCDPQPEQLANELFQKFALTVTNRPSQ
jgi:hypothetical protein